MCFWMSIDIRGKLASQNFGNSIIWTPRKLFIMILLNQKLLECVVVTFWIFFWMSTDIWGKLASQNLGNSIIRAPKKLLFFTLSIKSYFYVTN